MIKMRRGPIFESLVMNPTKSENLVMDHPTCHQTPSAAAQRTRQWARSCRPPRVLSSLASRRKPMPRQPPCYPQWRRVLLPGRLRVQDEGEPEVHLLHHGGEQGGCLGIGFRREAEEERTRGGLHDRAH